jgi:hypothetical protein
MTPTLAVSRDHLEVANTFLNVVGLLVSCQIAAHLFQKRSRRLLPLAGILLLVAWLESSFNAGILLHHPEAADRLVNQHRQLLLDLFAWSVLATIFVLARLRFPKKQNLREWKIARPHDLSEATSQFVAAIDSLDVEAVGSLYEPDFACIRLSDDGGEANLTGPQILSMLSKGHHNSRSTPALPTKNTKIHHMEIADQTGFVVMSRVKDLGNGWEPMFYLLVWKQEGESWRLKREFVHQRTTPNWS